MILSRNWRGPGGEVDLIATDGHTLIACEVKTRSSVGFGTPREAVDERRAQRVYQLAVRWLQHHRVGWCPIRVDVVAILWPADGDPTIEHHEGVL